MASSAFVASSSSAAFHVQVAIIGAGVVGLAIARSLAKVGKEVLILERASHICSGTFPSCTSTNVVVVLFRTISQLCRFLSQSTLLLC